MKFDKSAMRLVLTVWGLTFVWFKGSHRNRERSGARLAVWRNPKPVIPRDDRYQEPN